MKLEDDIKIAEKFGIYIYQTNLGLRIDLDKKLLEKLCLHGLHAFEDAETGRIVSIRQRI